MRESTAPRNERILNPYQAPVENTETMTPTGVIVFQLTKGLNRHAESKCLLYQNLAALTTLSIFAIFISLGTTVLVASYYPPAFLPALFVSMVGTGLAYNGQIKGKRLEIRKSQESLGLVDNVFVSVQLQGDDIEFEVAGTTHRWPLAGLVSKRTEYGLLLISNQFPAYLFIGRRGNTLGGSFRSIAKTVTKRIRELQREGLAQQEGDN